MLTDKANVLGLACRSLCQIHHSKSSLSPEFPSDYQQRGALPASTCPLETECSSSTTARTTASFGFGWIWPFPCGVLLGTPRDSMDLFSPRKKPSNSNISKDYLTPTTLMSKVHGKDEYLQAIQVSAPRFRFFGTFPSGKRKRKWIGFLHSQGHST